MIVHYYKFMVLLSTLQEDPATKRSSTVISSLTVGVEIYDL